MHLKHNTVYSVHCTRCRMYRIVYGTCCKWKEWQQNYCVSVYFTIGNNSYYSIIILIYYQFVFIFYSFQMNFQINNFCKYWAPGAVQSNTRRTYARHLYVFTYLNGALVSVNSVFIIVFRLPSISELITDAFLFQFLSCSP